MPTIRVAKKTHFTVLRNEILDDGRLSFRSKGLLAWLLSKPDDWTVSSEAISRGGKDGRDAVRASLTELEEAGYIERTKVHDSKTGQISTVCIVRELPAQTDDAFTGVGDPACGNPAPGEPSSIQELSLSTETKENTSSSDDDVTFERNFEEFWKMYPRKVGKPNAKKALRALHGKFNALVQASSFGLTFEECSDSPGTIATGLAKWVEYWKHEKTEMRFIPHPATWLNQRRWEDEPTTKPIDEVLPPGPPIALDIFKAWTDMKAWTAYKRPELIDHAREIMEAFVVMRRWHYSLGETMIRFALNLRWPDIKLCWDPKYLASSDLRTPRFTEMPVEHFAQWGDSIPTLVECLDWAFMNGRWAS